MKTLWKLLINSIIWKEFYWKNNKLSYFEILKISENKAFENNISDNRVKLVITEDILANRIIALANEN